MRHILITLSLIGSLAFSVAAAPVEIVDGSYEDRPQFVVKTATATYYFDRAGGGFSRLIDRDGNDWIAFSKDPLNRYPGSAAAGYRGMPNLLFGSQNPDAGGGHPGFDKCESELIAPNQIRTETKSGEWAWTWTFTDSVATMEMLKAAPDQKWWFLYEGPVAGTFNPRRKFWGTSNGGPRTDIPSNRKQFFDEFQWAYFGDRRIPRVLLLTQQYPDALDDTVWYLGSSQRGRAYAANGMLVFGFGRGPKATPLMTGAGQKFRVTLMDLGEEFRSGPTTSHHETIAKRAIDLLRQEGTSDQ